MAVPNDIPSIQYLANGSGTSFAYPAIIYSETELTVYGYDTINGGDPIQYVLNTDYTIDPSSLGNVDGVNVVFGSAPVANLLITILRLVPFAQTLELVEGAGFPSDAGEKAFDELEMQIQQLQDQLSRVASTPPWLPKGVGPFTRSQDLLPYDVSSGTTPQLSVTPGNYKDFTAGVDYIPRINNVRITDSPPPILVVGSSDTVMYAKCYIDSTTGEFTQDPDLLTGVTTPDDTDSLAYDVISFITPNIGSSTASVAVKGGGVSASRGYFYCGLLPATDGSGHLFNS